MDAGTPQNIVSTIPFLVLDEIGCQSLAQDAQMILDETIRSRYDRGLPTVLVSNLPLDSFVELLGDALTDRIRHAVGSDETGAPKFLLQFPSESFRRAPWNSYANLATA